MGSQRLDFAEFYREAKDDCPVTVLVSVGDRDAAQDLVAGAFARAWASWRTVSRHPAPAAWVVRTALNAGVSRWLRRRREVPPRRSGRRSDAASLTWRAQRRDHPGGRTGRRPRSPCSGFPGGLVVLAEMAELVVPELVTNAIPASTESPAQPPLSVPAVHLRLLADPSRVMVEVWDSNPPTPHSRTLLLTRSTAAA